MAKLPADSHTRASSSSRVASKRLRTGILLRRVTTFPPSTPRLPRLYATHRCPRPPYSSSPHARRARTGFRHLYLTCFCSSLTCVPAGSVSDQGADTLPQPIQWATAEDQAWADEGRALLMCLNSLVARVATQQAASTASIVWIEAALKYGSDKAQLDNAALDDRARNARDDAQHARGPHRD